VSRRCVRWALALPLLTLLAAWGCGRAAADPKVERTYDPQTGKLNRLAADLNGDGRPDTWTYMDGTTPLRTEQDLDGDGLIERWEYTRPDASIEKIAVSRARNGKPDMWTYLDASGHITRVEMAASGAAGAAGGGIERTEFYEEGRLVRVDEDTDGDGRVDKWEKHDGPTVLSVEFDLDRDGKPDERVTFGSGGVVTSRERIGRSKGSNSP